MKTSIRRCFLAMGILLVATARPAFANLIVNGDFETGTFAGWTTTPAPVGSDFGVGPVPPPHDTLGAFFGAFDADFDSISQTFVTTPGAFYDLSFFYQIGDLVVPPIGTRYLAPRDVSALADALDQYNDGALCAPSCDRQSQPRARPVMRQRPH